MRQGADQTPARALVAKAAEPRAPRTAATRGGGLRGLDALVATLLAATLVAAPAVAGPTKGDLNKRRAGAVAKECPGLKGKGMKRKGPKRARCHAGPTPAGPQVDRDAIDVAVESGAGPTTDDRPTDPGETTAQAAEASPDQPSTDSDSAFAVVPSCWGLDWKACKEKVRQAGFTNYTHGINPYDNCTCGPGGTWRIIDDFGEQLEGLTLAKGAHIIIETNPDA